MKTFLKRTIIANNENSYNNSIPMSLLIYNDKNKPKHFDKHYLNNILQITCSVGPLTVKLVKGGESLSAGKSYEAKCEVVGARPSPR